MGAANQGSSTVSLLNAYLWMGVWVTLSVSLILVNKHVIFYSGFHFPISLAFWHMFLATVTARLAVRAWDLPDTISQQKSTSLYVQVAMIGLLFGGTLVAGNTALLFLSVPTIQMLKAFNPVTVYVLSILAATEQPTLVSTLKVLIVCAGVAIAGCGDVSFSAMGVCLQLASSTMDAIRCVTLQRVLQANQIQVGPLVTLAHVAPFSMAGLGLPVVFVEGPKLVHDFDKWRVGIPMVVLSGLIASALNFVLFKVIGLTSALTTSVTGVFKDWACILLAMYLYNTIVSSIQWLGYTVAIAGLMWYHYGKFAAARANEAAQLDTDEEAAQPLAVDSKSQAVQQQGYKTLVSWSGKDADAVLHGISIVNSNNRTV